MTPTTATLTGACLVGWAALLAQPVPETPTTIVGAFIAISLGMLSMLGIVVKKLLDDARDDRQAFVKAVSEMRAAADAEATAADNRVAKLMRATDTRFEELRTAFQVEQREQRAAAAAEMSEMRKLFAESIRGMRVAVHDVRDAAQTAINKVAGQGSDGGSGTFPKPK